MWLAWRKDYAGSHIFGCSTSPVVYPRSCPPEPPLYVQPKLAGGGSLPRLLFVKPGRTPNEPLEGLPGNRKPVRAEMIA